MTTKNIRRLRCAWSDGHLESLRDGKPKCSDGCGDGEYNPAHLVCLEFWVLLIDIIVDEISLLLMSLRGDGILHRSLMDKENRISKTSSSNA